MLKLKTTPAQLANVYLPFGGFYENFSCLLDDDIQREIEYLSEEENTDLYFDDFNVDYTAAYLDISKDYAAFYPRWIKKHTGLDISCEFIELWSPREYNFMTDRIYAYIPKLDLLSLINWPYRKAPDLLPQYVQTKFKSRPGFIPFYDNDIRNWGSFFQWDDIQLSTMLEAVSFQIEGEHPEFYDSLEGEFWDYWSGNNSVSFYMSRVTGPGMSEVMEA